MSMSNFRRSLATSAAIGPFQIAAFAAGSDVLVGPASNATQPFAGTTGKLGANAGSMVDLDIAGFGQVRLGGAVSAGDQLTSDASSRAIRATVSGQRTIGLADEPGITGDIISYLVAPAIYGSTGAALPTITISSAISRAEGNSGPNLYSYTVSRSSSVGAVNVPWSFNAGSTSADDFTGGTYPAGGTVAMADGVASATITISVNGDASVESDEAFTVSISVPSGYAAGAATSATGTILNDDAPPAATAPAAPTMTVAAGNSQNSIAWTDGSDGGSAITGHKLYRSTTTGFTPSGANLVGTITSASPYLDAGTNGTAYYYRLSAVNSVGESGYSGEGTGTPIGTPTIAFANPTVSVAEGNSGTQAVPNTINVTRNGVTGALTVNLTYGGTANSGSDYATPPTSVTIPAGSSTIAFDLTINGDTVVEGDETIIINAVLAAYSSATATKTITITNDDSAGVTTTRAFANPNRYPGHAAVGLSNGTNTQQMSRVPFRNEQTRSIGDASSPIQIGTVGRYFNGGYESDIPNAMTVQAWIEYPEGTYTPAQFAGAASGVQNPGATLLVSDNLVLGTAVPAGAIGWTWLLVSVAAGGKWPFSASVGQANLAALGAKVERGATGSLTNMTPNAGMAVGTGSLVSHAILVTTATGLKDVVALHCDSIPTINDSGQGDLSGNTGYFARACSGRLPVLHAGYAGSSGYQFVGANGTYDTAQNANRRAWMLANGATIAVETYSTNDIASPTNLASMKQIAANKWAMLASVSTITRIYTTTSTPRTDNSPVTATNYETAPTQTVNTSPAGAFDPNGQSVRVQYNEWLRQGAGGNANLAGVIEIADALEVDATGVRVRNGGRWITGQEQAGTYLEATGTNRRATIDGTHPFANSYSPERGSLFIMRDAVIPLVNSWLSPANNLSGQRNFASGVMNPGERNFAGGLSNGTNDSNNSWTMHVNRAGRTVTSMAVIFSGWLVNQTTGEVDATPYTVSCKVEYPLGSTPQTFLFSGSSAGAVPGGNDLQSDTIAALTTGIPDGAAFRMRTKVSVASGQKFPIAYTAVTVAHTVRGVSLQSYSENGVGLADKTGSGTLTTTGQDVVCPSGIVTNGIVTKAVVMADGDSHELSIGSSRGADNNIGITGIAAAGLVPFIQCAVQGGQAVINAGSGKLSRRVALAQKLGVTHVFLNWSVNDFAPQQGTPSNLPAAILNIANQFNAVGIKVIWYTTRAVVSSSKGYFRSADMTTASAAGFVGPSSFRGSDHANVIRAKASPLSDCVELGAMETGTVGSDSGIMIDATSGNSRWPAISNATVASGATTTVIPSNASGAANYFAGGGIIFTSGSLNGTYAVVSSNTAGGQITLSAALGSAPAAGDTFTAFPDAARPTIDGSHPTAAYAQIEADLVRPKIAALVA